MESELVTLASVAAGAVVKAATTAAWEKARSAIGRLWQRAHPERVAAIEAELAVTRSEALIAEQKQDMQATQELVDEWRGRLRRLLAADPEIAAELRLLNTELRRMAGDTEPDRATITMTAQALKRGAVYQAGRDQHIGER